MFGIPIDFISALLAGVVALTVAGYERRSLPHWLFVAGLVLLAVESIFSGLAAGLLLPAERLYWQHWKLAAMALLPGAWLGFSLSYARGNYREFLARWRLLLTIASLVPIGLVVLFPRGVVSAGDPAEAERRVLSIGAPGITLYLLFLMSAVLVLMNLECTFRAAVGTMRWRIKFMMLGLSLLFAVRVYTASQCLLFQAVTPSLQTLDSVALSLACLLILRGLFRTGHADVSIYPAHAVLHRSFTLALAGGYLLIVGVFAKIVALLGGDAAFPLKAFVVLVVMVLLALLLLSNRAQLYTKRFLSRHFQRPLYNYRTMWRAFTEGTSSCVEPTELCQAVVKLVSDIFQVLSVTIWVKDPREERWTLVASSSVSETRRGQLPPLGPEAAEAMSALRQHSEPIDIDATKAKWAEALRQCHPAEFRRGGNRYCVPLMARGELLGLMFLGDRVAGMPFTTQDLDPLKCVGDQVAAALLNLRLSQRLLQAKEWEAFQTMSAFFVHDLKNTASTLSLMLQNFPMHYQDPAFREDALRGLSKAAQHIDGLIQRLSLLRRAAAIVPVESDLNEVVTSALVGLDTTSRAHLVQELRPLPRQRLDPEQIQKVVTNLVLNAREASTNGSQIRVETARQQAWTVLAVRDAGCGMSPEFMQRSLFRPFQTTKKQGIGIGMFQCKMIVEAHQGKIEVESEVGKGTTFRVLLPLA